MRLAIQINGEFLDLFPATVLELEEENAFLQTGAEIQGQYSVPVNIPVTEKNMRLLGFPNQYNIRRQSAGIEAVLWSDGLQHSRGLIKIEQGQSNINFPQRGSISIYYVFGMSDFWQVIKNKTLQDITYGDDITKPWSILPNTEPDGFFGFVKDRILNGNYSNQDYAFFPVVNYGEQALEGYAYRVLNSCSPVSEGSPGLTVNTGNEPNNSFVNQFCPFLYLSFILRKVFAGFGWAVTGDVFNETDFKKITVLHNIGIEWLGKNFTTNEVTWNLRNHVPKISIGAFLVALQNRFAWWYDFDYRKKICTIRYRKTILQNRTRKDFSAKAAATFAFKLEASEKIFALKQSQGDEPPDFSGLIYRGEVGNFFGLPAATTGMADDYYFVRAENAYYIITLDGSVATWTKAADNNFDYTPDDNNEEITTGCLVPDTELVNMSFNTGGNSNRFVILPAINLPEGVGETETFYIAYHHGMSFSINNTGLTDFEFPLSGAGVYDPVGTRIASRPLVFEFPDAGEDIGIYSELWAYFLGLIKQKEVVTQAIRLDIGDVLNLKNTDSLIINHNEYLIKNPKIVLPTQTETALELVRL